MMLTLVDEVDRRAPPTSVEESTRVSIIRGVELPKAYRAVSEFLRRCSNRSSLSCKKKFAVSLLTSLEPNPGIEIRPIFTKVRF